MSKSISDQLLKLGLVDKKNVRQSKHQQRQDNKQKGRDGLQAEKAERQTKAQDERERSREADRDREKNRDKAGRLKEIQHQIEQIVESGRVGGRTGGRRRFYYETRDDRVPCLELNDEAINDLQNGRIALAEALDGRTTLITREAAARIDELDRSWLAVWKR